MDTVKIERDYCAFVIILNAGFGFSGGSIPLVIEKGNFRKKMWKLPGGRPKAGEYPEVTGMREVSDEIGVVVKYPEKEIFRKNKGKYDFIVLEAEWFTGIIKPKEEIEKVQLFNFQNIQQMINNGDVLPDHAEALSKYIDEQKAFSS